MGTNYYLQEPELREVCPTCGRGASCLPRNALHIGKSSVGWVFALQVLPKEGLNDLPDWEARWSAPGAVIVDEYGETVSPEEMHRIITQRHFEGSPGWGMARDHDWWDRNNCEPGPNGLARTKIGRYCVGHGETWDLVPGEFS